MKPPTYGAIKRVLCYFYLPCGIFMTALQVNIHGAYRAYIPAIANKLAGFGDHQDAMWQENDAKKSPYL